MPDPMQHGPDHAKGPEGNMPSGNAGNPHIAPMIQALRQCDNDAAVRAFFAARADGHFTNDPTLLTELTDTVGQEVTAALVHALAGHACAFCKQGRSPCPQCQGHGHVDHELICEPCMGLGALRCDFCDGTGWTALEDVPGPLRAPVLVQRAGTALAKMKSLMDTTVPQASEEHALRHCAESLIAMDRCLGVLENSVMAVEKFDVLHSPQGPQIKKIVLSGVQAAIIAKTYRLGLIQSMADAAQTAFRQRAEMATPAGKLAYARSEYYASLADRVEASGSLGAEHPFLEQAIRAWQKKIHSKPQTPPAGA